MLTKRRERGLRLELKRLADEVDLPDTDHVERAQELVSEWFRRHRVIHEKIQNGTWVPGMDTTSMLATLCQIAESVIDHCETCGELLDKDCNGNFRCPTCDGPCPCCSDGPGPGEDTEEEDDEDWALPGEDMSVDLDEIRDEWDATKD